MSLCLCIGCIFDGFFMYFCIGFLLTFSVLGFIYLFSIYVLALFVVLLFYLSFHFSHWLVMGFSACFARLFC